MSGQEYIDPVVPGANPAEQMLYLSCAYVEAAGQLSRSLEVAAIRDPSSSVRVIFHLCRHATELFLKGAVALKRGDPIPRTHRLDALHSEYCFAFPAASFELHVPFGIWALYEDEEFEEEELGKGFHATHDQRYRYPVDSGGKPFSKGMEGPFKVSEDCALVRAFADEIDTLTRTILTLNRAQKGNLT